MRLEKMFTPLQIGNIELKNRFAVTAMVCNMCDEDGLHRYFEVWIPIENL